MSTLNQEAPPAEVKSNQNYFRFEPFPRSDSFVLTCVGTNYIPEHTFNRKDKATGKPYQDIKPAVELFFGGEIDGRTYFVKTWPQQYSISEKSNYSKYYKALTGAMPTSAQRPKDLLGKAALVAIETERVRSAKGTEYTATNVTAVNALPSILAATVVPLAKLQPLFDAELKRQADKKGTPETENQAPF